MELYNWRTAPVEKITEAGILAPPRKNRAGNKRRYQDIICAFDIETTKIDRDHSVMYIWQFQLGMIGTVIGRSWKEYEQLLRRLRKALPENTWLVIYVHNLAFEFQFLRGIYRFHEDEVFAVDTRKVLRADMMDCFEYRCSYLHSNMSLDEYLSKMGVEHLKQHGFDYDNPRYPWTPLSDDELLYCVNDVRGLVEAIHIEMLHDGDTLYTIPATSTGYVRRDVKQVMRSYPYHYVHEMLPDYPLYSRLREAFRGGNTHANRYYAGQVLPGIGSADESSAYPTCQCNDRFPVGPFVHLGPCDLSKVRDLMIRRRKAILLTVTLRGVRLRDSQWGCPYIPIDKCRKLISAAADNGRVLEAEQLEITLTDIDWRIILQEYDFDAVRVDDLYYAKYGKLPPRLIELIQTYYKLKTMLKGDELHRILYDKSKAKLNAIYGMSAQNPARLMARFDGRDFYLDRSETIEEILIKSNRNAFFPYQWGVWTTANARMRLERGIRLVSAGNKFPMDDPRFTDFVYCDTDSVKYIGSVDWSQINAELMEQSLESNSYADDSKGRRHYMGIFEPDEGYPAQFATRGSKKYVVRHPDGRLEATIAGVDKKKGGPELEANGGFEAFLRPVFRFTDAGGMLLRYNDRDRYMIRIDGHRLKIRECVTLVPDEYTLQDTPDYFELLQKSREYLKFRLDILGLR